MRKIGLVIGVIGTIGIMLQILMNVFIDISNVWFIIPVAMIAIWIISEMIENILDEKRNKKRLRGSI